MDRTTCASPFTVMDGTHGGSKRVTRDTACYPTSGDYLVAHLLVVCRYRYSHGGAQHVSHGFTNYCPTTATRARSVVVGVEVIASVFVRVRQIVVDVHR